MLMVLVFAAVVMLLISLTCEFYTVCRSLSLVLCVSIRCRSVAIFNVCVRTFFQIVVVYNIKQFLLL